MSINSVQKYVKAILDDLPLAVRMGGPGGDVLTAYITPPTTDAQLTPRVYIWGSKGSEDVATMPQPGNKKIKYGLYLWIMAWDDISNFTDADSDFPTVIDEVLYAIRSTQPMPARGVVDDKTERVSDILALGARMQHDYAPVWSAGPQSSIAQFEAKVIVEVEEWIFP